MVCERQGTSRAHTTGIQCGVTGMDYPACSMHSSWPCMGATGSWPPVFLGLFPTTQIFQAMYIEDRNFGYVKVLRSEMMQCT